MNGVAVGPRAHTQPDHAHMENVDTDEPRAADNRPVAQLLRQMTLGINHEQTVIDTRSQQRRDAGPVLMTTHEPRDDGFLTDISTGRIDPDKPAHGTDAVDLDYELEKVITADDDYKFLECTAGFSNVSPIALMDATMLNHGREAMRQLHEILRHERQQRAMTSVARNTAVSALAAQQRGVSDMKTRLSRIHAAFLPTVLRWYWLASTTGQLPAGYGLEHKDVKALVDSDPIPYWLLMRVHLPQYLDVVGPKFATEDALYWETWTPAFDWTLRVLRQCADTLVGGGTISRPELRVIANSIYCLLRDDVCASGLVLKPLLLDVAVANVVAPRLKKPMGDTSLEWMIEHVRVAVLGNTNMQTGYINAVCVEDVARQSTSVERLITPNPDPLNVPAPTKRLVLLLDAFTGGLYTAVKDTFDADDKVRLATWADEFRNLVDVLAGPAVYGCLRWMEMFATGFSVSLAVDTFLLSVADTMTWEAPAPDDATKIVVLRFLLGGFFEQLRARNPVTLVSDTNHDPLADVHVLQIDYSNGGGVNIDFATDAISDTAAAQLDLLGAQLLPMFNRPPRTPDRVAFSTLLHCTQTGFYIWALIFHNDVLVTQLFEAMKAYLSERDAVRAQEIVVRFDGTHALRHKFVLGERLTALCTDQSLVAHFSKEVLRSTFLTPFRVENSALGVRVDTRTGRPVADLAAPRTAFETIKIPADAVVQRSTSRNETALTETWEKVYSNTFAMDVDKDARLQYFPLALRERLDEKAATLKDAIDMGRWPQPVTLLDAYWDGFDANALPPALEGSDGFPHLDNIHVAFGPDERTADTAYTLAEERLIQSMISEALRELDPVFFSDRLVTPTSSGVAPLSLLQAMVLFVTIYYPDVQRRLTTIYDKLTNNLETAENLHQAALTNDPTYALAEARTIAQETYVADPRFMRRPEMTGIVRFTAPFRSSVDRAYADLMEFARASKSFGNGALAAEMSVFFNMYGKRARGPAAPRFDYSHLDGVPLDVLTAYTTPPSLPAVVRAPAAPRHYIVETDANRHIIAQLRSSMARVVAQYLFQIQLDFPDQYKTVVQHARAGGQLAEAQQRMTCFRFHAVGAYAWDVSVV